MKKQAKRNQIARQKSAQKRHRRAVEVGQRSVSQPLRRGPLRLPALPAGKLAVINAVDPWSGIRTALRELAQARGEWAGYPLPMDGMQLTVEPTYPQAKELMAIGTNAAAAKEDEGRIILNQFWSSQKRGDILIWREPNGRIEWGVAHSIHSGPMLLATLGCADAWGIEQEARAIQQLGSLLRHRQFKQYLLTGSFMERSQRSGVHYIFRKLRPTIAMSEHGGKPWRRFKDQGVTILAALCLHPVAYYSGSWGGAMCPTDDVIAHLMLMRGDEKMFWRRANQHPPWRPEAGL